MTLSLGARAGMLDGFVSYLEAGGTPHFTLYQTNTALAVFALEAMSAAVNDSAALVSAQVNSTGTEVAGTANRFVITNGSTGATALSGSVGAVGSGADIETPSLTVTAAATQTLNALVLRMDAYGNVSVEASLTLQ